MDPAIVLATARWTHFCAETLLFGGAVFALRAERGRDFCFARVALAAALVAFGSGLAWVACSLLEMADGSAIDADMLSVFFFDTGFGTAWLVRLGFLVALVFFAALGARSSRLRDRLPMPVGGLSGALLISQAWLGHAASASGWRGWIQIAVYAAHVLAAAAWLGGLPSLALAARHADARTLNGDLDRFSALGVSCVLLILASGLCNVIVRLESADALIVTLYGRIILAKLALLAVLLGVAAMNRLVLMPRLRSAVAGEASLRRSLIRNIMIEQGIGAGVLLAAAILGMLSPFE